MSIKALQQRLTQVGVIRLGETRISKNNKPYPAKLGTFRLTSPSEDIIRAVAGMYGGEVRAWPDGPSGPEWQVTTGATALEVYVLPQQIDPNLELWGNGYRSRMCDGETEKIRQVPCVCEAAARVRYQEAGIGFPEDGRFARQKTDCKPTTRISVALKNVSDGQWKLESHGWNAAAELPTKASVYLAMALRPVPAVLRMDQRSEPKLVIKDGKEEVEPRNFAVPVLDFGDLFTIHQALTGGVDAAVQRALEGETPEGQRLQAIAAAAAAPPPFAAIIDWVAMIAEADSAVKLNDLRERMQRSGVRDESLVAAWKARGQDLVAASQATPTAAPDAKAPAEPAADVVDAEVEPDADGVWNAILKAAQGKGWNLPAVEGKYRERMGHDPVDADGFKLTAFLAALTAGEVQ